MTRAPHALPVHVWSARQRGRRGAQPAPVPQPPAPQQPKSAVAVDSGAVVLRVIEPDATGLPPTSRETPLVGWNSQGPDPRRSAVQDSGTWMIFPSGQAMRMHISPPSAEVKAGTVRQRFLFSASSKRSAGRNSTLEDLEAENGAHDGADRCADQGALQPGVVALAPVAFDHRAEVSAGEEARRRAEHAAEHFSSH